MEEEKNDKTTRHTHVPRERSYYLCLGTYGVGDVLTTLWSQLLGIPEQNLLWQTTFELLGLVIGLLLFLSYKTILLAGLWGLRQKEQVELYQVEVGGLSVMGVLVVLGNLHAIGGSYGWW